MGSCAAPSAKGDDKFITTDYLQQCPLTEKQIFVPPRLSPPSDDVRGLDCPFAIARRL
uniref:hypothetical protein n=1 Tax=Raoultella ornithinolytica TaxID=54291 RepID=UPI00167F8E4A|nr:hypothetical protein [Raoultella ornithinolytica]